VEQGRPRLLGYRLGIAFPAIAAHLSWLETFSAGGIWRKAFAYRKGVE
jgi:hypothetical protein